MGVLGNDHPVDGSSLALGRPIYRRNWRIVVNLATLRNGAPIGESIVIRRSETGGAVFDPTNSHRYILWRNLVDTECSAEQRSDSVHSLGHDADTARTISFIMLNPNRADELSNDPTIKRCIGFARGWGFLKIIVVNLFSIKAQTPALLRQMRVPLVGPSNDAFVLSAIEQSSMVVAAWGNHGSIGGRDEELLEFVETALSSNSALRSNPHHNGLYCLGLTKLRQPKHPLYLRASIEPVRFIR